MPFYSVNGRELYYELAGSGPPVILIHGFLGDSKAHFGKQFKEPSLNSNYTLIAPDLRGFGKSQIEKYAKWGEPHTADQLLEDLDVLIKNLHLERDVIIGGYSVGAALALEYAKKHQNLIKGIFLISPRPFINEKGKSMPYLSKERRSSSNFIMRSSSNILWGILKRQQKGKAHRWIKGKTKDEKLMKEFSLLQHIPTALIYANKDSVTPQIAFDVLKENLAKIEIIEFDGDHGILHEKPDEFNQALKTWLDKVSKS
jgi:pimeloyl-ACP methyl ester carboxylesterase